MFKTTYHISQMDCSSEEGLIRMKLSTMDQIKRLDFDIPSRTLDVYHQEDTYEISFALEKLNLGSTKTGQAEISIEIDEVFLEQLSLMASIKWIDQFFAFIARFIHPITYLKGFHFLRIEREKHLF